MAVEWGVIQVAGIDRDSAAARYDFDDAWSSMSAGGLQQLFLKFVITPVGAGAVYIWAYDHLKWLHLGVSCDEWPGWLLAFCCVDFCYYWFHRWAHANSLLWLGHSVHHDSEHYNFSTALRQGALQAAVSWLFYIPLAPFFDPKAFLTISQLNTLYQFWLHTCVVRRLGPMELVFLTPSHHRVHHDRRVHKNFGGVLILWDKLFGSFLDEDATYPNDTMTVVFPPTPPGTAVEEHCLFGQRRSPRAFGGTTTLQLDEPVALLQRVHTQFRRRGFRDALWALVCGPGFFTAGLRSRASLPAKATKARRFRLRSVPRVADDLSLPYLLLHTIATYIVILRVLFDPALAGTDALVTMFVPVSALVCHGLMLDGGSYGVTTETTRCAVTLASQVVYCSVGRQADLSVHGVAASAMNRLLGVSGYSAWFWLHVISLALLINMPTRFERQSLRY
mmetsp:Transcript_7489/g.22106  ORF Transcript_7489/g.22106 Transcript_7489/m.22106 type:complete len:448 (+) Transcript_7489:300-1643(+)